MAKIGNEAKLILKLAEERMAKIDKQVANKLTQPDDYKVGFNHAVHTYKKELLNIANELETK